MVNNELISMKKDGEQLKILIRVAKDRPLSPSGDITPTHDSLAEIKFSSVEEGLKFYTTTSEENLSNLKENKKRIDNMPKTLCELNEFVEVINRTKCLSKRNNDKITGIINAYNTRLNLVRAVEEAEETQKEIAEIIENIKKVE